jgi:anti-anti-sigma factor
MDPVSLQSLIAGLNLLPQPIAVVDTSSALLYFNSAEARLFGTDAHAQPPLHLGREYLSSFCAHLGIGATEFAALSAGLLAVLRGDCALFEQDLACQSAEGMRWFALSIAPVRGPEQEITGALIQKQDTTARMVKLQAFLEKEERLRLLSELAQEGMVVSAQGVTLDANAAFSRIIGYPLEEIRGQPSVKFVVPECHEAVWKHTLLDDPEPYEVKLLRKDGTSFPVMVTGQYASYRGQMVRVASFYDLTRIRQVENALHAAQAEQLRNQAEMLAELSTPIIPLNDQILVMPLIGNIDSRRAEQVLTTLLQGIQTQGARAVIIDITGVRTMDSYVVSTLIQAVKAARLLGAKAILTGIRAEIAQLLVRLGIDLSQIVTHSRLQSGIADAIHNT